MTDNQLDKLSVDQLIELKDRIEQMIQARIDQEREALLRKLDAIRAYESRMPNAHNRVYGARVYDARARPAPKYRDPGTGATWTGRGKPPRWMREAIQAGKSPDDFLIPIEH